MKKLNLILLTLALLASSVYASETDQYMTWGKTLPDSSQVINDYLNQRILKVLAKSNKNDSCQNVTSEIFDDLKGEVTFSRFNLWARAENKIIKFPDPNKMSINEYGRQSIHRGMKVRKFFAKLAPTVNINGVYVGLDKLSHFSYNGRGYYRVYLKALEDNKTKDEAILEAIKHGVWTERYMLGYYMSGVFSVGDLEANYQGLRFGIDLCEGENSILVKGNQSFQIRRAANIADYINPNMDESFTNNIYHPHKFKQMKEDLKQYCKDQKAAYVLERFIQYQYFKPSFNMEFLASYLSNEVWFQRRDKQSLEAICE